MAQVFDSNVHESERKTNKNSLTEEKIRMQIFGDYLFSSSRFLTFFSTLPGKMNTRSAVKIDSKLEVKDMRFCACHVANIAILIISETLH